MDQFGQAFHIALTEAPYHIVRIPATVLRSLTQLVDHLGPTALSIALSVLFLYLRRHL